MPLLTNVRSENLSILRSCCCSAGSHRRRIVVAGVIDAAGRTGSLYQRASRRDALTHPCIICQPGPEVALVLFQVPIVNNNHASTGSSGGGAGAQHHPARRPRTGCGWRTKPLHQICQPCCTHPRIPNWNQPSAVNRALRPPRGQSAGPDSHNSIWTPQPNAAATSTSARGNSSAPG